MSFALNLALRYLRSKKRGFISAGTAFAIIGVALGTAALVAVMSVTGGFRAQFQDKVLGVNGHVVVLRSEFRNYRAVIETVRAVPDVLGVSPFVLNAMMLTHGERTATGVMLKGVEPSSVGQVLDLPEQIVEGSLEGWSQKPSGAVVTRAGAAAAAGAVGRSALPLAEAVKQPSAAATSSAELPAGSIVPEGGYTSVLPSDDALTGELGADEPCGDASEELPGIVIGSTLRDVLALRVGDCVVATSPTIGYALVGGAAVPPLARPFRVIAIFQAGFEQYDARFAYSDLREAQAFYSAQDSVTGVEIKVADVDRARSVAERVGEQIGDRQYRVIDWMELNHGLFTALRIQQLVMSMVLGLIILIATFTVLATLAMLVRDKKKDIAVMKAMGASDAQLLRAFMYQGLIIGLAGTLFGLSSGYAICRWVVAFGFPLDPKVYFIDRLPVQLRAAQFVVTGVFAIACSLLATVWPALHAARLRPIEAFRDS